MLKGQLIAPTASRIGGMFGSVSQTVVAQCRSYVTVTGLYKVGGLFGTSIGEIYNSFSANSVTGMPGSQDVGGFAGTLTSGIVSSCYSSGSVSGGDTRVGGFVGILGSCIIENCYAIGNVGGDNNVGGFLGAVNSTSGKTRNCYSTGYINISCWWGSWGLCWA